MPSCKYFPFHSKAAVAAASTIAPAQAGTDAALEKANSEHKTLVAKTRANIQTARKQNATQPAGNATTIVEGELGVADERLSGTPADSAELLASASREALVQSGKAAEARSAYEKANTDAKADAARAASAETDARLARERERQTIAEYEKKISEDAAATQAKMDKLKDAEAHEQAKMLRWIAAGCLAIFLLATGFGQWAGAKLTWPFGVTALLLFGLAQLVTQTWFIYATNGVLGVIAIVVGWWAWQHYKQHDLLKATEEKAAKLTSMAKPVVETLDTAYNTAAPEIKVWLQEHVFNQLDKKMDLADKATVHEVRAA